MKKLIFSAICFVLFAGVALAQPQDQQRQGQRTPPTVEQRIEMMSKNLDLNKKQKDQIKMIFEEQDKKMKQGSEQADRRALMQETDKKVNAILTKEQQAKMAEMRKNRQQRGGGQQQQRQ